MIRILLAVLLLGFSFSARALTSGELAQIQQFFGMTGEVHAFDNCTGEGYDCNSSLDCCSHWCNSGKCYEIGGSCRGVGASCSSSLDCCSHWCNGGECYEIGACKPRGAKCGSSIDCCSGLSCWSGHCK